MRKGAGNGVGSEESNKAKVKTPTKMYLTIPFGHVWHVFGEDDRSLCGKALMLHKNPNACEPVTGAEKYRKGQDCKACFRRAGLNVGDPGAAA